jgi:hypothetical protein
VIGFDRLAVKRIGVAQLADLVVGLSDVARVDHQPETIVFDPGFARAFHERSLLLDVR